MPTALDALLESLDPSRTLDVLSARADEALNTFRLESGVIANWDTFQACMSRYYCHLEHHLLRLKRPREEDFGMDWGRCQRVLLTKWGPLGTDTAFSLARTGAEGGLYGLLKMVAHHVADEYASNEIKARVSGYMTGLSAQERLAATQEYLNKYGHLLPGDVTEGSAPRINFQFFHVLCEHPRLLRRLHHVGR